MVKDKSFRFRDDCLHRQFLALLKKRRIKHSVGRDGRVHYSEDDEDVVENEVVCPIRDSVFATWQVLTCPRDWIPRYTDYMRTHGIPFQEELSNGELWFLLPRSYRPHRWKLEEVAKTQRIAV